MEIAVEPVVTRMLRPAAFAEGVTLAALVFIGMPLKYGFGITAANAILGPLHGFVFFAYVGALLLELRATRHSMEWVWQAMLASLIPGVTFWFFTAKAEPVGTTSSRP
jgi:integral membrane protein